MGHSIETQQTQKKKKAGPKKPEVIEKLKVAYIEQLIKCGGIGSAAQKAVGVDYNTIQDWSKKDPEFKAAINNVDELAVGEATSLLWEEMHNGNATAIIFYLKTRGSKYGFAEKQQIDINGALASLPKGLNGIGEQ